MTLIENRTIEELATRGYTRCDDLHNMDFSDLWNGFRYHGFGSSFIREDRISFEDYVGCKLLTGNELLYYPELARRLRKIKEYPTLTRDYAVDRELKGFAFLEYFPKFVAEKFKAFRSDLAEASRIVNNLIHIYGNVRYLPLVDSIEEDDDSPWRKQKIAVINGVRWYMEEPSYGDRGQTGYIALHRLLRLSRNDFEHIEFEDALLGTPFIAFRIKKTWEHKGHVNWYNLDTCQQVYKADIRAWKKPA